MAVKAQYPLNVFVPEWRNRITQMLGGEDRYPFPLTAPLSDDIQNSRNFFPSASLPDDMQIPTASVGVPNQLQLFSALPGAFQEQQQTPNVPLFNQTEVETARNVIGSRKRAREAAEQNPALREHFFSHPIPGFHLNQGNLSVTLPLATGGVSTGLRLSFDDNRLNSSGTSTSGRAEILTLNPSILEELATEVRQQRDEIDQYIRVQGEQLKCFLEQKRQKHARALVNRLEEGVSQRLREKEVEVEKTKRRNLELEEKVKQLSLETRVWQSKAKCHEAMVTALRSNLQQAEAQSREQSKEGCGDSEADDTASSHLGENADIQARIFKENKELKEQRTCRVCRSNEVCMLLLPCRHLCLCKDCEARLKGCPLCRSMKSASVQVYMT